MCTSIPLRAASAKTRPTVAGWRRSVTAAQMRSPRVKPAAARSACRASSCDVAEAVDRDRGGRAGDRRATSAAGRSGRDEGRPGRTPRPGPRPRTPRAIRAAAGANRSRPWKVAGALGWAASAPPRRRRRARRRPARAARCRGPTSAPPSSSCTAARPAGRPHARVDDRQVHRARQQRREPRQHQAPPRTSPGGQVVGEVDRGRRPGQPTASTACSAPTCSLPGAEVGEQRDHGPRSPAGVLQQGVDQPRDGVLPRLRVHAPGPPRARSRW